MGFSSLGFVGSKIFAGNCEANNVKIQHMSEVSKNGISFNSKHCYNNKVGRFSRPILSVSSKFESFQFEERTSPNEVNPVSKF